MAMPAEECPRTSCCLRAADITLKFGGITALDGVSLEVSHGAICGLIGPNGAGKTTFFNVVSRLYTPGHGTLEFYGRNLLAARRHEIVSIGIARTFQNVALCRSMSVLQNVLLGGHARILTTPAKSAFLGQSSSEELSLHQEAMEMLALLDIAGHAHAMPADLPFGTQKRVELARALMAHPQLLMLDEPANGLSHHEVDSLVAVIKKIQTAKKLTVMLVEHHMGMVFKLSDSVIVLEAGRKLAEGTPEEIRTDVRVAEAYLGRTA